MNRLSPAVTARLAPEVESVCERFVERLGPRWDAQLVELWLHGPQLRRHAPGEPFRLLLVVRERTPQLVSSLRLVVDELRRTDRDGELEVETALVTLAERASTDPAPLRAVREALQEGVRLWSRGD